MKKANDDEDDDLPDLKDKGVQDAALKIQSVYRGFQTRKEFQARTTTTKEMQKPVKGIDQHSSSAGSSNLKIQNMFEG